MPFVLAIVRSGSMLSAAKAERFGRRDEVASGPFDANRHGKSRGTRLGGQSVALVLRGVLRGRSDWRACLKLGATDCGRRGGRAPPREGQQPRRGKDRCGRRAVANGPGLPGARRGRDRVRVSRVEDPPDAIGAQARLGGPERCQCVGDVCHRLEAARRLLLEAPQHHGLERGRDVRVARADGGRPSVATSTRRPREIVVASKGRRPAAGARRG